MRGPGIVSEARQHLRTSPPTDSLLTCLMETVVVDDVVTSASAGRCHPVCHAMTVESDPRPADARALRAPEPLVVLRWVCQAHLVPLLSAQLSFVCTGDFEV